MLDVIMEVNKDEEPDSLTKKIGATNVEENGILRKIKGNQALKRRIPKYYDRQQQLELVLTA
jgi:hypothetical protein